MQRLHVAVLWSVCYSHDLGIWKNRVGNTAIIGILCILRNVKCSTQKLLRNVGRHMKKVKCYPERAKDLASVAIHTAKSLLFFLRCMGNRYVMCCLLLEADGEAAATCHVEAEDIG